MSNLILRRMSVGLDGLCVLAELPRRTFRYYIQIGLLEPPGGAERKGRWACWFGV